MKKRSLLRRVSGVTALVCFAYIVAVSLFFAPAAEITYNIWPQTLSQLVVQPLFLYSVGAFVAAFPEVRLSPSAAKVVRNVCIVLPLAYLVLLVLAMFVPALGTAVQAITGLSWLFTVPGTFLGFALSALDPPAGKM